MKNKHRVKKNSKIQTQNPKKNREMKWKGGVVGVVNNTIPHNLL